MRKSKKSQNFRQTDFWKKLDVISKIALGFIGLLVACIIQYQQFRLSESITKFNRRVEETRIKVAEGQLAATLIENVIKGDDGERKLARAILNSTTPQLYVRLLEALSTEGENEQIRKYAINELGIKGDDQSIRVLKEILNRKVNEEERKEAERSRKVLDFRLSLKDARALYNVGHYPGAVEEFNKIVEFPKNFNVDRNEITLAQLSARKRDYLGAAKHYIKAFEKVE